MAVALSLLAGLGFVRPELFGPTPTGRFAYRITWYNEHEAAYSDEAYLTLVERCLPMPGVAPPVQPLRPLPYTGLPPLFPPGESPENIDAFREYAGMPPVLRATIKDEGNAKAFDACARDAAPGAYVEVYEEQKPGECPGGCVYPASTSKKTAPGIRNPEC